MSELLTPLPWGSPLRGSCAVGIVSAITAIENRARIDSPFDQVIVEKYDFRCFRVFAKPKVHAIVDHFFENLMDGMSRQ